MNKEAKKIEYIVDGNLWSETQCPSADFLVRVGSLMCRRCKYYVGQDPLKHYVLCKIPKNKKLVNII